MTIPRRIRWMPALAIGFSLLAAMPAIGAYSVNVGWLGQYSPTIFSVGSFIPAHADAADIEFRDIEPFVQITLGAGNGTEQDSLYLWIVMQSGGGNIIFSVRSDKFSVATAIANHGGTYSNHDLAYDSDIRMGSGGNMDAEQMMTLDAEQMMTFIDGSNIAEGYYLLTVAFTDNPVWDGGQVNYGMATLGFLVSNPSQVGLELPDDNSDLTTNPVFMWQFPRKDGVSFLLEVVSGDPDADPWSVMESPNPSNIYAQLAIPVESWLAGGYLTAHIYTGSNTGYGDERSLVAGTYFWRVTATASGMFPGEFHTIESPVYRFNYNPPGGGDEGGYGGGDLGNLLGGGGGDPDNPPPAQEDAILSLLRSILPQELFDSIFAQLGDLTGWSISEIHIGDRVVTLQELVNFLLSGGRTIVLVAVSQ